MTRRRLRELKKILGLLTVKESETKSGSGSDSDSGSNSGSEDGSKKDDEKSEKSKKVDEKSENKKDEEKKEKEVTLKKGKKGKNIRKEAPKESVKSKKSEKAIEEGSSKKSKSGSGSGSNSGSGSDDESSSSNSESEGENNEESESVLNNRLAEEKDSLEEELEELLAKSNEEVFEDFIQFLEIDYPSKYKAKAKGLRLAFDVKDAGSRIPLGMKDMKIKNTPRKFRMSAQEIKEKVKIMKNNRINKKLEQEMNEKIKYEK